MLVTVECSHCGAMVTFERQKGAARCPFCDCVVHLPTIKPTQNAPDFEIRAGVLVAYHGQGTDVSIPYGVCRIGDRAFAYCTGLSEIYIPDTVTEIGNEAFIGCKGLADLHLPDSVEYINEKAFLGCNGLESLTIPEGVQKIGSMAFLGCYSLRNVQTPERWQYLFPPFWNTEERKSWQVDGKCMHNELITEGSALDCAYRKWLQRYELKTVSFF